jgi:bacillithiol biosynthesis cysteine-adding enzyme BshC
MQGGLPIRLAKSLLLHGHFKYKDLSYTTSQVACQETGFFGKLVTDYLGQAATLHGFYTYTPNAAGVHASVQQRLQAPSVDRTILVRVLEQQYEGLQVAPAVRGNIKALANSNTFTVTTAHQPNLFTGYLYFIYKILHAVSLAAHLNSQHPDLHFVPVYYMGSEDNDLDELGVFRFRGTKYRWDGDGQSGAVGRMATKGLKALINEVLHLFGPPGPVATQLAEILRTAYLGQPTIGRATQYLVNELFGRFGLVVLDPDNADLKRTFIPYIKDDLLRSVAYGHASRQTDALAAAGYKTQAFPRAINLFYLAHNVRERIEHHNDRWEVLNTDISFSEDELMAELNEHPERFSPNVILRGLFQSVILPDVAFIGGGAEVAYWLQLGSLFTHYGVHYPAVLLRQSVMVIPAMAKTLMEKMSFSEADLFLSPIKQSELLVARFSDAHWQLSAEKEQLQTLMAQVRQAAAAVDPTLTGAAGAAQARMDKLLLALEKKMLRAAKNRVAVHMQQLQRLRALLYPNDSLQERTDNFAEYYLDYGPAFFDAVLEGTNPYCGTVLLLQYNA